MKSYKRFKQSYKDTINNEVEWSKTGTLYTRARIAYSLKLGEMFEWANECRLSSVVLYKYK